MRRVDDPAATLVGAKGRRTALGVPRRKGAGL